MRDAHWRKWCDDKGLKYGWSVPQPERLLTADFHNVVLDPRTEQDEIDFRPHGYNHGNPFVDGAWKTEDEDVAGNIREASYAIINHANFWWFDMFGHFYATSMMISPEKEKILKELLCCDGRTLIWCYAPGVCDGKVLDENFVMKWAGVPFGTKGIGRTDMGGWTSVYVDEGKSFNSENLRQILLDAGVHSYVDGICPVSANERLLSIHTAEGGTKTITLRKKASRVVELVSGKTVARRTRSFSYEFLTPDTRLFEIEY